MGKISRAIAKRNLAAAQKQDAQIEKNVRKIRAAEVEKIAKATDDKEK